MLKYVDLEYMTSFLLARNFKIIDYWSLYNDIRRDYIKLVRGVIFVRFRKVNLDRVIEAMQKLSILFVRFYEQCMCK